MTFDSSLIHNRAERKEDANFSYIFVTEIWKSYICRQIGIYNLMNRLVYDGKII